MQIYRKIIHLAQPYLIHMCVDDNILDEGKMYYVKDQTSFLETNLPFINNNERIGVYVHG